MSRKTLVSDVQSWFSHQFSGTVWNTLAHQSRNLVFLEIRSEQGRQVTFSCIDLDNRKLLFDGLALEENWWVSLAEVSGDILLFKIYTDTNNPDRKSVLAYDYVKNKIVWWRNNYAISSVNDEYVLGTDTGLGTKFLALRLEDGLPSEDQTIVTSKENFLVHKPLQYFQETTHFETIRTFLSRKFDITAASVIEYLEWDSLIIMSFYTLEQELANYLMIISDNGGLVLKEKIGEQLKGIGHDTFFILSGYLIFVKNKRELVSLKLV